ncbi:MAG TPA: hypothetical protein VEK79_06895 [Thermoanaerobaculia bacterium]|nr:hypothetical protein [Thermoanaerobaculia bacterium]
MGVALTYVPITAVPVEIARRIVAEAHQLGTSREWWCEALHFTDETSLEGSTKIFLPGYSIEGGGYREVDVEDDSLMAAFDASFILDTLASWSRQFDISWSIGADGGEIGEVSSEGPDPELLGMVAAVATNGEFGELPSFDTKRIADIQKKYADRLERW